MGQVEVFKRNRTGVVGVRNLNFILIFLPNEPAILVIEIITGIGVCGRSFTDFCFGSVTSFRLHGFRENILSFKQHLNGIANLVDGPFAALERGNHGDQYIGIVLDIVKLKVVFIVIMSVLIGIEILPQLIFKSAVLGFGSSHITIFHRISGRSKSRDRALRDDGAGRHHIEQKRKHRSQTADKEKCLFILGKELRDFLRAFRTLLGSLCSDLRRFCSSTSRMTGFSGQIFLLNGSLLLPARIWIA